MNRTEILDTAKACVTRDRQQTYGSAENNFRRVADFWSTHLGAPVTAIDVAVMLGLLKVARIHSSPGHADNWVDLAGYAACGGEIAADQAAREDATPGRDPDEDDIERLNDQCEEIALRVMSTPSLAEATRIIRSFRLCGSWDDEGEDFGEALGSPAHWDDEPEVYAVEENKDAPFAVGLDSGEDAGEGDDRFVAVPIEPEISSSDLEIRIRAFLAHDTGVRLAQFSTFCAHIGSYRVASYSRNNRTRLAFYLGCAAEDLGLTCDKMDEALRLAGFEFGAA